MITIKNGFILQDEKLVKKDIYIENDKIIDISDNLDVKGELVDAKNGFIMCGGVDAHVHLREPGFAHKETIKSGTSAAAKGGITTVLAMPNLSPCPDCKSNLDIELGIISKDAQVEVLPYGSLTINQKSIKLVDFKEILKDVVGFTDDGFGVNNIPLLEEAMKKAKELNFVIASHAEDSINGKLPEGEYKAVLREIEMAKKIGCKYHFCHLSTKESFDAVRTAHNEGFNNITCEVTPHHLILNETMIKDGNWKMNPPLRSEINRLETLKALLDGTASIVASDHAPHSEIEKALDYDRCPNGILGIETMIPIVYTSLVRTNLASFSDLENWFVNNPRKIFGLKPAKIDVGEEATLTILNTENKKIYTYNEIKSLSKNSPYIGMEFYGFPLYTIYKGNIAWRDENEI